MFSTIHKGLLLFFSNYVPNTFIKNILMCFTKFYKWAFSIFIKKICTWIALLPRLRRWSVGKSLHFYRPQKKQHYNLVDIKFDSVLKSLEYVCHQLNLVNLCLLWRKQFSKTKTDFFSFWWWWYWNFNTGLCTC
jgi:hypothetical protein